MRWNHHTSDNQTALKTSLYHNKNNRKWRILWILSNYTTDIYHTYSTNISVISRNSPKNQHLQVQNRMRGSNRSVRNHRKSTRAHASSQPHLDIWHCTRDRRTMDNRRRSYPPTLHQDHKNERRVIIKRYCYVVWRKVSQVCLERNYGFFWESLTTNKSVNRWSWSVADLSINRSANAPRATKAHSSPCDRYWRFLSCRKTIKYNKRTLMATVGRGLTETSRSVLCEKSGVADFCYWPSYPADQ